MLEVAVLGATGSIGRQTADVLMAHPERLRAVGLAAHHDVDGMAELAARLSPTWVVMEEREAAARLRARLPAAVAVEAGSEALVDRVASMSRGAALVSAMSGFAGLRPTLAGAQAGLRLCLANKETLVAAGDLVRSALDAGGGEMLPVDSEHSALFQALGHPAAPYRRLWLCCTGGPFRGWTRSQLKQVTVEQALRHPVWRMGSKITIDSATLMNKGLEIIEAHFLFNAPMDRIDVVVHPQGVVHSLVEFVDGAVMAQLASPDMRLPIQLALSWPERWSGPAEPLDLGQALSLEFTPPDRETFHALDLARAAGETGGTAPAVLNAANEVAIERFVTGEIGFLDITDLVESVLQRHRPVAADGVATVEAADEWARRMAHEWRR
jgi:1-deoxy-D-xylulose-5-phosphate reductoisomerase